MSRHLYSRLRDYASVVLVTLFAVAIWSAVSGAASALFGSEYSTSSHFFRAVATSALVIGLLIIVTRFWVIARPAPTGLLPDRRTLPALGVGALGYLVPFAVASAVVLGLSAATLTLDSTPLDAVGQVAAVLVLVLLYEAIPEELVFRGFIFAILRRRLPGWATVIVQAALFCVFGVLIGAATTPDRLLLFALFSLSLGVVRASTGSVFAAVGFHAAFQTVTQPVLGEQWTAFSLDDPDRWYVDIAYGLAPLLLGPVLVVVIVRLSRRLVRLSRK